MGELGLTGAPLPESVGGSGFSYLGWTLVMEELGAADMATAVTPVGPHPVAVPGRDVGHGRAAASAGWRRWSPARRLGAFALTEPHAGSDAAAIRTRAERVGPADAPEGTG